MPVDGKGGSDMLFYNLPNGDVVHRYDHNIVMHFAGKRKVLSTAPHNGGYREDLTAVFNHDGDCHLGVAAVMKAPTYREHMLVTINEIGLDPETVAGLETAASMSNAAVRAEVFEDLTVTAIVTGGIETNGGRVGDPAGWHERREVPQEYRLGTINILLHIDGDLSEGAIARALVTCTEAKTAAIQELLAESRYSRGLATGSGTDGTIIIADAESRRYYTGAGKHCKLGELIGRAVKPAVKEALFLQTGLGPAMQHNALRRLGRFGVTEAGLYHEYTAEYGGKLNRSDFSARLEELALNGDDVAAASLIAHLLDQLDWGLLGPDEALRAARSVLEQSGARHRSGFAWPEDREAGKDAEAVIKTVMDAWRAMAISYVYYWKKDNGI
jgi:adenosylcobinamide amidohydrolase